MKWSIKENLEDGNSFILTRTCDIGDNPINSMVLPNTVKTRLIMYYKGETGCLIQDVFPDLDADKREFIFTGITPELWDEIFNGKEEE